uniref:PP1-binding domain-containing protein n=1 Tax=Oryzias sinensis TaxID=183150 RepID=A0A8C7ZYJ8_9TELE
MIAAGCKGDQEERISSKEKTPSVLSESNLNFSELTPQQFGISTESFTPSSSSQRQDKSRLAQIKARRRSSVGVRGSPETNSLIRFMAQQKMKTAPSSRTPEIVRGSPLVASTLKQKMASFQSLMDVVEREAADALPEPGSGPGGCRNPLSGEDPHSHRMTRSVLVLWLVFEDTLILISDGTKSRKGFYSDVCCFTEEGTPSVVKVKKQVRFGSPLSPEFFDKNLPPSTPLQKGGTPARGPTPGGGVPLRSVLKTPQSCEARAAAGQLDCLSPSEFEVSPTLVCSGRRRINPEGHDGGGEHAKVEPLPHVYGAAHFRANLQDYGVWLKVGVMHPHPVSVFLLQPEESEPVKRSTRSAAKSACGRLKVTSTRKWNKGVDRSLYGSRAYASKNPSLSPIRERLSLSGRPPAVSCSGKICCGVVCVGERCGGGKHPRICHERRRQQPERQKRSEGEEGQRSRQPGASGPGSWELPSQLPEPRAPGADGEDLCSSGKLQPHESPKSDGMRGGELPDCTEEAVLVGEVAEGPPNSSGIQEEGVGVGEAGLAPWQADFNFEDVFKPVATRGQRSVRRSLRNQSNVEHCAGGAGLAWVPHTSPEAIRETRRRTGGRRRSAAPPIQPAPPEEAHNSTPDCM